MAAAAPAVGRNAATAAADMDPDRRPLGQSVTRHGSLWPRGGAAWPYVAMTLRSDEAMNRNVANLVHATGAGSTPLRLFL
jgi:hypothetical protein